MYPTLVSPPRILLALLAVSLSAAAMAECKLVELAKIPVTMHGLKPIVPARINGSDVRFLFDSGAFFNRLSSDSAAKLKLQINPLPVFFESTGFGGVADDTGMATVPELSIAGAPVHDVRFIVGGEEFGQGVVGLLGQNVLSGFDIDYDLANGVIRLMHPDKDCVDTPLAYWAGTNPYSTIDIQETCHPPHRPSGGAQVVAQCMENHTLGTVEVNGQRMKVMFDTGADDSMIDGAAAQRAGVTRDSPGVKPGGIIGGLGHGRVETFIAPFDSFQIGGEKISHTRLRVGSFHMSRLSVDMLIGADFFLSHRVLVSNLQHRMYFTYSGGPVFNLSSRTASVKSDTPREDLADADSYGRRAAASAARGDLDGAVADLTRASELEPREPKYLAMRADAHLNAGDRALAKSDLDRALSLGPGMVDILLKRAEMLIEDGQADAGVSDLEAASRVATGDSALPLKIATLYVRAGRLEPALAQYDGWIDAHPDDSRLASTLNGRCWTRTLSGKELDKALSDCNRALKLAGDEPGFLDSRGLVRLRQGDYDGAIGDYDRALKEQPDLAWSLYGRGLSKLRKGRTVEAQADLDAAKAADPKIAEEAARYGIAP